MAENFDLIFGSSASQSYSWNDSDYQNGWQTVGDTPPTREQFDALQRRADLKAQELNNALTPLVNKSEADGRQASTAYTAGKFVTVDGLPNGWLLECVVGGTSGASAISIPATLADGTTIVDGDVTWKLRKIATEGGLGYRQPSTTYAAGAIAYHASLPTGYYLECTTAGQTGSGELTITSPSIGGTVSDGTVTWTIRKSASTQDLTGYLPLSGGAMTGGSITRNVDDSTLNLYGGNGWHHGANISLRGKDHSELGRFIVEADDSINVCNLIGKPTGELTWGGNSLDKSAVVAESLGTNGYRKYASGLIEQWGVEAVQANTVQTVTLPVSVTKVLSGVSTVIHNQVPTQTCISIVDMAYDMHSSTIRLAHSYPSGIGVGYRVVCI